MYVMLPSRPSGSIVVVVMAAATHLAPPSQYNFAEHDRHEGCKAQTPLGYIWLDRKWREKQPDQCIMGFMALAGEKDSKRQGE